MNSPFNLIVCNYDSCYIIYELLKSGTIKSTMMKKKPSTPNAVPTLVCRGPSIILLKISS